MEHGEDHCAGMLQMSQNIKKVNAKKEKIQFPGRVGADGCAPRRVTDIADAAPANLTASGKDFPSVSATHKLPQ